MRATIEDVAREAGVSVATVSRALRGMDHVAEVTRDRVVATAQRLGYSPHFGASLLAGGATRTIGLVAPYYDIWYTSQVLAGVEEVLSAAGHDLVIYAADTPLNREQFLSRAHSLQTRIDGLLIVDFFPDVGQLQRLIESGLNLVAIGEDVARVPSLSIDNFDAAFRATRHLIEIGHTRIGIAGGQQVSLDTSPVLASRIDGYQAALADAGLKELAEYRLTGMLTVSGGRQAIDELADQLEPPTAVFFMSDEMAMGGLAQARRLGIDVPGDLSIIGFDDHDLAEATGLSTMRQRVRRLGSLAAERMLSLPDHDSGRVHELMPVELVVRDSTAPPR
ncbi:MAG: LacI family transcriptional regulator [bacterium]|nr:LacI family transcriptional regulator [bacterium]